MALLFANNASSSIASSITAAGATITLATGGGAKFPSISGSDTFYATLIGYDSNGVENAWEVVSVTARSTDTLTVTRAQEGTTGRIWAAGTRIELRATKATFEALVQSASPTFTGIIFGDFSNATISSRLLIKSNVTNGNTGVVIVPNGTATTATWRAYNSASPDNASVAIFGAFASEVRIASELTGSGSYLPVAIFTGGSERLRVDTAGRVGVGMTPAASQGTLQVLGVGVSGGAPASSGTTDANQIAEFGAGSVQLSFGAYANGDAWIQQRSTANFATNYGVGINPNGGRVFLGGGLQEARVAMAASNIDLSAGNYFTKTISGTTTLTVSNVPASGTTAAFILDLTNGGSATVNWWSAVRWANGSAPTLTASGRDVLAFFTHDNGTNWNAFVLGKDVR